MTRRHMTLLVIIAIPLTLVYCFSLRAEPPRNPGPAEDLFAGKILIVTQRMTPAVSMTLEDVRLTRLGDQPFLVGKGVDDTKGWANGRTIWVPVAEVNQIAEFSDRSDLIKATESRQSGK